MDSSFLIITNIGFLLDAALLVFLSCLILVKGRHKRENLMLVWGFVSILFWVIPQVIGVNILNPQLSRDVLTFHLSILFISCFISHFIFIFLGKEKEQRPVIIASYTFAIIMTVVYLAFPNTFILDSIPKLYFPNYYVAGSLHWIMTLVSNILIPAYFLIYMAVQYPKANDVMKNRIKYLFFGFLFGYSLGALGIPLVYTSYPTFFGVLIDPVYSIFFIPLFTIPFTYAVLKYELMDIRIVAKRAFIYALIVALVGIVIGLLQYANDLLHSTLPAFPQWILPLSSSAAAVAIGFFIWGKLRESDLLKYEFITVVTHKFRTPLTEIRWATESLSSNLTEGDKESVGQIRRADEHLIELTNLLVQLSSADLVDLEYQLRPQRFDAIVESLKPDYVRRASLRNIVLSFAGSTATDVLIDDSQMRFVIQTLLDNALNYTPKGGTVSVELREEKNKTGKAENIVFSVADSGVGFSSGESGRLFEKFWRSPSAHSMDTEGMGIGLFMTKRIIERQNGAISAESAGQGKGATFLLRLPIAEN